MNFRRWLVFVAAGLVYLPVCVAAEPEPVGVPTTLQTLSVETHNTAIERQLHKIASGQPDSGKTSRQVASLYYDLALMYVEVADHRAAVDAFQDSINHIRTASGDYSPALAPVLARQGVAYYTLGLPIEALAKFHEAQHIIHRADGVKSVNQGILLDWMTVANLQLNQTETADKLQRLRLEIYRFNFGRNHPKMVPALLKLGTWLQNSGQFADAANTYEEARRLTMELGMTKTYLNAVLRGLAYTSYLEGKCCASDLLVEAAASIVNDSDFDDLEKSRAYIDAADMSLVQSRGDAGQQLYEEAWTYSGGNRLGEMYSKPSPLGFGRVDGMVRAYRTIEHRSDVFTTHVALNRPEHPVPARLVGAPLPLCASSIKELAKGGNYENYIVDLDFEVSGEGRATNVKVIDSNAPSVINRLIQKVVRLYRFRPTLKDGKPVNDRMRLQQTFGTRNQPVLEFPAADQAAMQGCQLLAVR